MGDQITRYATKAAAATASSTACRGSAPSVLVGSVVGARVGSGVVGARVGRDVGFGEGIGVIVGAGVGGSSSRPRYGVLHKRSVQRESSLSYSRACGHLCEPERYTTQTSPAVLPRSRF